MKQRLLTWIVVVTAAVPIVGVTTASAGGGDTPGGIKGRLTLESEPVAGEEMTLNPGARRGGSDRGPKATTDSSGRFIFDSVKPARYKLFATLTLEGPNRMKCRIPGYVVRGFESRPGTSIWAFYSSEAFSVKAGKTVTRNGKADCKPDATLVPPTSSGDSVP